MSYYLRLVCAILMTLKLTSAFSSVPIEIIENWDTTPKIPDEARGWDDNFGPATVLSSADTGNFITTGPRLTDINLVNVPNFEGVNNGFSNGYVGNKNYQDMGVTKISFIARLDLADIIPANSVSASIVLLSDEIVPDPNFPGGFIRPQIWSVSKNEMVLGEGWEAFTFDADFTSEKLPDGWSAFPDSDETWNMIKQDVDQIIVVFNFYTFGIFGLPRIRDNSLDNFTLTIAQSPIAVPLMNTKAIVSLAIALLTFGSLTVLRRS